jgi:sigma-54 dependent transcriptional regulator, acetoin dehydrogenase operon transcriptional activator AcoR
MELMDPAKSPLLGERSESARQVRLARTAVRSGGDADQSLVRPVILASWKRCREAGLNPATHAAPIVAATGVSSRSLAESELVAAAKPILGMLTEALHDRSFLLLLADDRCRPIEVLGTDAVLRECERINVTLGSDWTEPSVGTDALALSSLLRRPIQVHWFEHYAAVGDRWTGSAAPIHDPATGTLAGTVSIYGYGGIAHPRAFELAVSAAREIEARMTQIEERRRIHLLDAFSRHLARFPNDASLCLSRRGMVLALSAAALETLGVTLPRAAGRSLTDLPGLRLPRDFASLASAPGGSAFDLQRGDDSIRASLSPIPDGSGTQGFVLRLEVPRASAPARAADGEGEWGSSHRFDDVLGESDAIRSVLVSARAAARKKIPILLLGESGTGKELFAHAIHAASARSAAPFVPLNCGALGDELLAAELFGYEDGAFTGAARGGRPGKLEIADGGTLFLDEVEAMSPRCQVLLLRFLEDGRILRVGGRRMRTVDVRIVAASNEDLRRSVERRRFRRDLFYRLEVFPIRVPPLRERLGDLPILARHLLAEEAPDKLLSPAAIERLVRHDWPGNVRELRNVLVQAAARAGTECIGAQDLPLSIDRGSPPPPSLPMLRCAERDALIEAMQACKGNVSRAAARLAIHRVTLHRKLKRHGIRVCRRFD